MLLEMKSHFDLNGVITVVNFPLGQVCSSVSTFPTTLKKMTQ